MDEMDERRMMVEQENFMFDTMLIRFGNEPLYKKARWIDRVLEMGSANSNIHPALTWDDVSETIDQNYDRNNNEEVQRIIGLLLPEVLNNPVERMNRLRWMANGANQQFFIGYPHATDEERQETLFDIEYDVRRSRRAQRSLCSRVGNYIGLCGKQSRKNKTRNGKSRKGKQSRKMIKSKK